MCIMIKQLYEKHKEIIVYIIFGGLTTVVNWLTYGWLVKYVHININISNVVAWIVAVLFAYFTNKIWVFNSKKWDALSLLKEFSLFIGARLISGIFEIISLPVLIFIGFNQQILGIDGFFAKVIISIFVVLLNYITSKLFIFKQKTNNNSITS